MEHICGMTLFLNPTAEPYERLFGDKAPGYVSWSEQNRSQLIRIPAAVGAHKRLELRSPDCCANPYLAFALLIYAGLDGVKRGLTPPPPVDLNLASAPESVTDKLKKLPEDLSEARQAALSDGFIKSTLPAHITDIYTAEG